ncbi:hypothetical protein PMI07_006567 [Rhizobium sp. CF080]|uniref:hypothetical protein n=1 Tax=Rhizobium sp. (strain CF080) TaxID=1144310 RepID=UPI0002717054|nr:hypothetical protein [Rhizobium sp. CF080]EUB98253.1 hypothetical protein PMI07_006567 [Rhizobium sp. CF080]
MMQVPWSLTRPLKIYATDPTRGYEAALTAVISVEYEPLKAGPIGERLEVVDYDGGAKTYYDAVDLDDKAILMQGGLSPSEADPRFHQQMVYAVASRTLSNFDRALGRRINLAKGSKQSRLRLLPHAFRGRNAFYDRELHALLFGYFDADETDPGTNMPGQKIFTCLSHDIIAHEMTHAIVDRLRRYFLEPTNVDVLAFHEGFSDIVALLQHFSFPDLVMREIQRKRGDIEQPTVLVELAQQFGFATGHGKSLRSALDDPGAVLAPGMSEAHDRGAILVAAIFDGFFQTYRSRIRDIVRVATGGSGELPVGDLQPHLAKLIAAEASRTAQRQLEMCIRAFDYLPPVDVTFGDYLRAMVTADFELNPEDEWGQRAALIEGFRRRGIYPEGVFSLAEESLRWPVAANVPKISDSLEQLLPQLLRIEADRFSERSRDADLRRAEGSRPALATLDGDSDDLAENSHDYVTKNIAVALHEFAKNNALALSLNPDLKISVSSFNAVFRTASNGRLLIELVAQLTQLDPNGQVDVLLGGITTRGGTTIIVGVDGQVRYAIAKPLPNKNLPTEVQAAAESRVDRQRAFVSTLDLMDPRFPYMSNAQVNSRMKARMSIRGLHGGR